MKLTGPAACRWQPLEDLYAWLKELLMEEGADEARQRLEVASWLDFTRSDNLA